MIKGVYSIRDSKVGYLLPTADNNDSVAVRNFAAACKHPDSLLQTNPQDFDLYCIGQFDDDSGELIPCTPKFIAHATDFVREV